MNIANGVISLFSQIAPIEGLSGKENKVAQFIVDYLEALDFTIYMQEDIPGGSCGNLIAKYKNGGEIALISHMDTARSTANLKIIDKGDKLESDKTTPLGVDNRAGISALLYASKLSREENLQKGFTLIFTVQEETTMNGSRYLKIPDNVKKAVVFDSHLRPGNFISKSCGAIGFEIKIIGKASHSGIEPEKGINSIKIAAEAISELELGRIDEETTTNIGIIKGGDAVNAVPEITELTGEVRSMNENKAFGVYMKILKKFEEKANALNAKVIAKYEWDFKPYEIEQNGDLYKLVKTAIENLGLTPKSNVSYGGSDANSLNEKGIPTINLGIGAANPHSNDEYIYKEDLLNASKLAIEVIKNA